jgi:hypothetical protein
MQTLYIYNNGQNRKNPSHHNFFFTYYHHVQYGLEIYCFATAIQKFVLCHVTLYLSDDEVDIFSVFLPFVSNNFKLEGRILLLPVCII